MENNKQINTIINQQNSFDDNFINYKVGSRLYAYPIIWTKNAWSVLSFSPILWGDETNGLFFINDCLVTNSDVLSDTASNRNLTLLNCFRFYSLYKEDQYEVYYLFLSRFATKALLRFHQLTDVESDEIVGALTLYSRQEAMTLLLTNRKTDNEYMEVEDEYYKFNEYMYPTLKEISTRNIYMGLIYKLQVELLKNEDGYVWNSTDMNEQFNKTIREQYINFVDIDKDICHLINPKMYGLVFKTNYSFNFMQTVVARFVNNTYNFIIKNTMSGMLELIRSRILSKIEIKLFENTYKYLFGCQEFTLGVKNKEQMIRNTLVLYCINRAFSHVERGSAVSALWLYRNLFYLSNNTDNEYVCTMVNILLQCVLYSNSHYFKPIISKIKNLEFNLEDFKVKTSWMKEDDMQCLYKLLYYFNSNVSDNYIEQLEQSILGQISNIANGYDLNTIESSFEKSVINHSIEIKKEREFYAKAIYEYIESLIEIDPHFGYE